MQELPPAEFTKHIDKFLLAVGPATGQLMNLLIKEAKARTILELGTSHGYSTLWVAEAAREQRQGQMIARTPLAISAGASPGLWTTR